VRALLLICLLAPLALAEDEAPEKAQARVLLSQGNALFERGDLKGALVDFRAAYALYPSPKLLVNCAAAARELGDLAAAANDLRRYLDEAGEDDPPLAERARGDLRALEKRLGRITIAAWPARSTVEINGRPGRELTYVKPGTQQVKVRAPTGEQLERTVEVGAGDQVDLPMVPRALPPPIAPTVEKKRSKAWVAAVVVAAAVVVGGAVGLGVYYGTRSEPQALSGDLGSFRFSEFR
jgi:tetratricopeptide (TPR) repeat protein